MKTITRMLAFVLLSCSAMLFDLQVQAQDYPYPGDLSPIWSTAGGQTVDCGNLENPDQKTYPIWYKVSGKIAQPQQHNKLHDPNNPAKAGSKVQAGNYVDVNFNVNKNIDNRYTLVSYKVNTTTGLREIFDYQSNLYNSQLTSPPVQGNSNQQLVLVPTNCPWEVYWVKGCVIKSFTAGATGTAANLIYGADGNPYGYDSPLDPKDDPLTENNLVLGYTFGDAAPNTECELCPVVVPNGTTCVTPQLIEVIELAGTDSVELIFSVINNVNTVDNSCYQVTNKNGQIVSEFPEIGDILFLNIFPSHTGNNQPYAFRYNYQLGPNIPGYPIAPPVGTIPPQPVSPAYQGAFVFDQRNNHNILDYDIYQSEIVRFILDGAEYARLNDPNFAGPKPQICIELSNKHPEPHNTLPPVYCFELQFDCLPECPTTGTECERTDCAFSYIQGSTILHVADQQYQPDFLVFNDTGRDVLSVTFTVPLLTAGEIADLQAAYSSLDATFTITTSNTATNTLIIFTQNGDNWDQFEDASFTFFLPKAKVDAANGEVTMTILTTDGPFVQVWNILDEDCGLIPLPVELISFTGAPSSEGVILKWATASEKSNDHYDIQRSADGKNFEKIGEMKGNGTTSNLSEYQFLDKHNLKGMNYYRLKQVDFDGTHAFTPIVRVNAEKGSFGLGVKLVPNPCSDQNCSVLLQGVDATKSLVVEMKDLTGRTVFKQEVAADQTSFNLPKANLGKGIYILSAKNGPNATYQKVIIQ